MSVSYLEDDALKLVELEIDGAVSRTDFETLLPKMQSFIERHEKIRLIEVVKTFEWPGVDMFAMFWEGMKFDFYAIPRISHCAVVSDIGWMSPLSKAAGAVISTKLRTFEMSELDTARDWIKSAD